MVFVTGGTGLVGSHLICALLRNGQQVRALKRTTSDVSWFNNLVPLELGKTVDQLGDSLKWIDGDVNDIICLLEGMQGCDEVYHCAAMVSFSKGDKTAMLKVNHEGTANVVNACLGMENKPNLCFISSTASIGGVEKKLVNESEPYSSDHASSFYSYTKYLAELEAFRGREEGLNVAIINPCIILGYANWNNGPSKFFRNGKNGFPFYTPGSNAFVDARDVADASMLLMKTKTFHDRFLCTGWNKSFYDVFLAISESFGSKPPRIKVQKWLAEISWRLAGLAALITGKGLITKESARAGLKEMRYSSQKLIDETGFTFRDFDESIREICRRYRETSSMNQ
jgi:nucleoside-diphosphate-sugar epimerase